MFYEAATLRHRCVIKVDVCLQLLVPYRCFFFYKPLLLCIYFKELLEGTLIFSIFFKVCALVFLPPQQLSV